MKSHLIYVIFYWDKNHHNILVEVRNMNDDEKQNYHSQNIKISCGLNKKFKII